MNGSHSALNSALKQTCKRMVGMIPSFRLPTLFLIFSSLSAAKIHAQQTPDAGVVIRGALLQPFVEGRRQQKDTVTKTILGSDVQGCQTTITDVRLQIVPDNHRMQLQIVSSGIVESQTRSLNPQALVESSGHHTFNIVKPVFYDGNTLLTQRGYGTIQARQTPWRVYSSFSASPLIGPLADRIAWQEVVRRSPLIDQAVAEDLSTDILPKIDQAADRELADLSRNLQSMQRRITSLLQIPQQRWHAASDDQSVVLWADPALNTSNDAISDITNSDDSKFNDVSIPALLSRRSPTEDVVLIVSDRLATRLTNQLLPPGTVITDATLNSLIESANAEVDSANIGELQKLISRLITDNSEPAIFSLKMATSEPLQIRFENGQVRVRSAFEVIPKFGPSSGLHITEVAFRGQPLDREHWTLVRGELSTLPEQGSPERGLPKSQPDEGELAGSETSPDKLPVVHDLQIDDSLIRVAPVSDPPVSVPPATETRTTGSVWTQLIQTTTQTLLDKLPPSRFSRTTDLTGFDKRLPQLQLERIQSQGGVLRLSWRRVAQPTE